MKTANSLKLAGFLGLLILVLGGVSLLKGGLYTARHEGDTLHLAEIVLRMTDGEWPHLDFLTPIGTFAFAPIVVFTKLGFGIGMSLILAQIVIAFALVPVVIYVAKSRLNSPLGYVFGAVVTVLTLALVHGEAETGISVSMHYNRWAWVAAAIAIMLAVVPNRAHEAGAIRFVDGTVIGFMVSILAMIKMTYFVAFIVPLALGLVLRGRFKTFGIAVTTGLVVAAAITLIAGPAYWAAYLSDLLVVSQSDVRSFPGKSFGAVVASPAYLAGSLVGFVAVVFLRHSKKHTEGLLLLLLLPGFFFVTFQNFANDPQWLMILALLIFASLPAADVVNGLGWNMRQILGALGVMAVMATAPSFINLAYSPLRHYAQDTTGYTAMVPAFAQHNDLKNAAERAKQIETQVTLATKADDDVEFDPKEQQLNVTEFQGDTFDPCRLALGFVEYNAALARDLAQSGFEGNAIFTADLLSPIWMFGDFKRLEQGSPWFYGGLLGYENADLLMVPNCAIVDGIRDQILDAVAEKEQTQLLKLRRTPYYTLYEIPKN